MMNNSRLINVLQKQIVSEKTVAQAENKVITFKVNPKATKADIKAAVETFLNLEVISVNTLNMSGKKRRSAHGIGCRSDWKKAYVTVTNNIDSDTEVHVDVKESN